MSPSGWNKTISPVRDQTQSRWLTTIAVACLLLACSHLLAARLLTPAPVAVSVLFAAVVWRLRAATAPAAAAGALVCLLLSSPASALAVSREARGVSIALLPLLTLFLLTFAATRFKRRLKESTGVAEKRSGRRASQIVANLGVAGLSAAIGLYPAALAALAEAAADTVASEIGQALGGETRLVTDFRPVSPGTDGAISARGSLAGLLAAATVVLVGCHGLQSTRVSLVVLGSAIAGFLFDSLLGATAERRGWIGNDLVNFASTLAAASVARALLR